MVEALVKWYIGFIYSLSVCLFWAMMRYTFENAVGIHKREVAFLSRNLISALWRLLPSSRVNYFWLLKTSSDSWWQVWISVWLLPTEPLRVLLKSFTMCYFVIKHLNEPPCILFSQEPITSSYTAFRRLQMKSLTFHSDWKFTKVSKLNSPVLCSQLNQWCATFYECQDIMQFASWKYFFWNIYIHTQHAMYTNVFFFFWWMEVIEAICDHHKTIRRTIKTIFVSISWGLLLFNFRMHPSRFIYTYIYL